MNATIFFHDANSSDVRSTRLKQRPSTAVSLDLGQAGEVTFHVDDKDRNEFLALLYAMCDHITQAEAVVS